MKVSELLQLQNSNYNKSTEKTNGTILLAKLSRNLSDKLIKIKSCMMKIQHYTSIKQNGMKTERMR